MNNVLLGKTIKAMYKQSGKTIAQLSEETDLTIDTINNLFYARIQKPGLSGVCALVKAMGYQPSELIDFMDTLSGEDESIDVTERFTTFLNTVRDTVPSAEPAKAPVKEQKETADEQVIEGYRARLEQLKESGKELSEHFERSIAEINRTHEKEISYLKQEIAGHKKTITRLGILLAVLAFLVILLLFIDAFNHDVGWFR